MFYCQEGASQGPSRSSGKPPSSTTLLMSAGARVEGAGTAEGVGRSGADPADRSLMGVTREAQAAPPGPMRGAEEEEQ